MRQALLKSCADSAQASALGALLSCVTLMFCLNWHDEPHAFSSDANVQKPLDSSRTRGAPSACVSVI